MVPLIRLGILYSGNDDLLVGLIPLMQEQLEAMIRAQLPDYIARAKINAIGWSGIFYFLIPLDTPISEELLNEFWQTEVGVKLLSIIEEQIDLLSIDMKKDPHLHRAMYLLLKSIRWYFEILFKSRG